MPRAIDITDVSPERTLIEITVWSDTSQAQDIVGSGFSVESVYILNRTDASAHDVNLLMFDFKISPLDTGAGATDKARPDISLWAPGPAGSENETTYHFTPGLRFDTALSLNLGRWDGDSWEDPLSNIDVTLVGRRL